MKLFLDLLQYMPEPPAKFHQNWWSGFREKTVKIQRDIHLLLLGFSINTPAAKIYLKVPKLHTILLHFFSSLLVRNLEVGSFRSPMKI